MSSQGKRGSKKGKSPAKKRAHEVSPPPYQESSDEDEFLPQYRAMIEKLNKLERDKQAAKGGGSRSLPAHTRRAAREQRREEMRQMGNALMARISVLEAEKAASSTESIVPPTGAEMVAETEEPLEGSVCTGTQDEEAGPSGMTATPSPWSGVPPGQAAGPLSQGALALQQGESAPTPAHPCTAQSWPWGTLDSGGPTEHGGHGSRGISQVQPTLENNIQRPCNCAGQAGALLQVGQGNQVMTGSAPNMTHQPSTSTGVMHTGSVAFSFGSHVSQETIAKIINGEYVDIFSLLNKHINWASIKYDDAEKERVKKKKPERCWANWLPAFITYAGILVGAKPELGAALFKHVDHVYRAYVDFTGPAWLSYDEQFREELAKDGSLKWGVRHQDLWLQNMSPARPNIGMRFDSGHLIQKNTTSTFARPLGVGTPVQPRQPPLCWEFNSKGTCSKRPCRFRHACSLCAAGHPSSTCPRGKSSGSREQGGGKRPQPGGGAAGKGAQPS